MPAASNKQGRDAFVQNSYAETFTQKLRENCRNAYAQYEFDLANKIPAEIARMQLPLNIYTKWLWKQDLHNIMHFIAVRIDSHAQWEAQQYAQAVYTLLKEALPYSMELFDEYRRLPVIEPVKQASL